MGFSDRFTRKAFFCNFPLRKSLPDADLDTALFPPFPSSATPCFFTAKKKDSPSAWRPLPSPLSCGPGFDHFHGPTFFKPLFLPSFPSRRQFSYLGAERRPKPHVMVDPPPFLSSKKNIGPFFFFLLTSTHRHCWPPELFFPLLLPPTRQ